MTEPPPDLLAKLKSVPFAQLHTQWAIPAVKDGRYNALLFMDQWPWFKSGADWTAWRAFVAALYALPMTPTEFDIYRRCTGRTKPPEKPFRKAYCIAGRRSRKSSIAAALTVFRACFYDYSPFLAPGETARIPIVAKSMDEAHQIHAFCRGIIERSKLRALLVGEPKAESIELSTRVEIKVRACNLMAGRSRAIALGVGDELAFWRSEESVNPDKDIIDGIEAGMTTIPDALTLCFSSAWEERGLMYEMFRDHWGRDDSEILVWRASTLTMHSSPQTIEVVEKAYRDDAESAAVEYGSEFKRPAQAYVSGDSVRACVITNRTQVPPSNWYYFAFVDPSGGQSDAFTLGIAHADVARKKVVLDFLKRWPAPFKDLEGNPVGPSWVVGQISEILKRYKITRVTGDRYGGDWPADAFRQNGIAYLPSERTKSDIFVDFLPDINNRRVELLDDKGLIAEFTALEDRPSRLGKRSISHPLGGHDDQANAASGCCLMAAEIGLKMDAPEAPRPEPANPLEARNQEFWRKIAEMRGERDDAPTASEVRRGVLNSRVR